MIDAKAAFVVKEPSGKEYAVYEDGRVEGFASGSLVFNRIPLIIRTALSTKTGRTDR